MTQWRFLDLKILDFEEFLKIQDLVWKQRIDDIIDNTIIFAEHPTAISINQSYIDRDLKSLRVSEEELEQLGIQIIPVKRGGGIALHAPGILGCYIIAKTNGAAEVTYLMERWIFSALARFGIQLYLYPTGARFLHALSQKERRKYRGFWRDVKKIGTEGLRISSRVSRFGVNINVCPDLKHLTLIHPCGITKFDMSSLDSITQKKCGVEDIKKALRENKKVLEEN